MASPFPSGMTASCWIERVGDIHRAPRDDDVVQEARLERVRLEQVAARSVVYPHFAGGTTRDPQPVRTALIVEAGIDATGRARGERRVDGAGPDVDPGDGAVRHRAREDRGPAARGDAFGSPAVGQVDPARERRGERGSGGQCQGDGRRGQYGETSGHASVLQRAGTGRCRRVVPVRVARGLGTVRPSPPPRFRALMHRWVASA